MAKILLNGSEPTDIKLNGTTPDKIMLNGVTYWEKPEPGPTLLYDWDFTESLIDKAQNVEVNLFGSNASNITRDSEGIHITQTEQKIGLDNIDMRGKTLEIDIPYFNFSGPNVGWMTCIVLHSSQDNFICPFQLEQTNQLRIYGWALNSYTKNGYNVTFGRNDINNKTIKLIYGSEKGIKVYVDDVLLFDNSSYYYDTDYHDTTYLSLLGGLKNDSAIACYNMTISGVRIYENEA